jgi:hypothetical protein
MESSHASRPRVSRETRLLVTTALLAIVALWVLARVRFPGLPSGSDTVQPILTTLAPGRDYDGLAASLAQVRSRIGTGLVAIDLLTTASGSQAVDVRDDGAALRLDRDLAVMWLRPSQRLDPNGGARLVARDAATGLAVVKLPGDMPALAPTLFTPRQPQRPRYVLASQVLDAGVSLRPVFVPSLAPADAARWGAVVWQLPPRADLVEGEWLFTTDAELVGLAVTQRNAIVVVPGDVVLSEVDRLKASAASAAGELGVQVQALTPALSSVTGAAAGVVVTWVDPMGPARGLLRPRDVIEAADGERLPTLEHWQRRVAQFAAGTAVSLSVRRNGDVTSVSIAPVAPRAPTAPEARPVLGLVTRRVAGVGAQVVQVTAGSIAARSGLVPGDIVTSLGEDDQPTPDQVRGVGARVVSGAVVVAAVQRGRDHLLVVLQR